MRITESATTTACPPSALVWAEKTATGVSDTWSEANLFRSQLFSCDFQKGVPFTQSDPKGWSKALAQRNIWVPAAGYDFPYALNSPFEFTDPTGESALGVVAPIAGGCVVIDGPLPIGDSIAASLILSAVVIDGIHWALSECKDSCEEKDTDSMKCRRSGPPHPVPFEDALEEGWWECIYVCEDGSLFEIQVQDPKVCEGEMIMPRPRPN